MTDAELIAQFIAEHGVTKCPVAAVAQTTGTIDAESRAAHRARGLDPVGDACRAKHVGWAWRAKVLGAAAAHGLKF